VPGSAVPGRQIEQPPRQPESELAPQPVAAPSHDVEAPPGAAAMSFQLNGLTVDGMTVFDQADISWFWQRMIGHTITVAGLFYIANAITRLYADAGYVLSFAVVPEQKITDGMGTVRIHVIEGYVDKINFAGAPLTPLIGPADSENPQGAIVSALARKVLDSRPLQIQDLERYLLIINDLPGVTAHATFAASATTPGASALTINVERQMASIDTQIDNRLPDYLGHWNGTATATLNGFLDGADQLSVMAGCGVSCDVYHVASGRWSTFVGAEGLKLSAMVTTSYDAPEEGFLQSLSFYGRQTNVSFSGDYPFIRSRQQTLTGGVAIGGENSGTWTFAGPLTRDQIRTTDIHGSYDFSDEGGGRNLVHAVLTQGLPVFNGTAYSDPLKSRLYGDSTFTILQMDVTRNQPLADLAPPLEGFSLYLTGWGQADLAAPLLSVSQCSYGGSYIGRSYNSGSLSGDHCAMGLAELRRDVPVDGFLLQPYVSADAGGVWEKGPLVAGEQRFLAAESVAAGLRLNKNTWFASDLQVAQPLRASSTENKRESPRLFLTLLIHM
jgi:hemolysin activation/secretion protein